jgi:hypothetical protein
MAGAYMRGALIEFMPTFLIPLPNIILFQYNPETMQHQWTQPKAAASTGPTSNPLAVQGNPGESFSFTLAMDAGDQIADGSAVTAGLAQVSGIYSRLAALEMLQYPVSPSGGGLLGTLSASIDAGGISAGIGGSASAVSRSVPAFQLPTVLFIWGPGRILPVRVTSLNITEKLYDGLLNPTHAEAQIALTVLTPEELDYVTGPLAGIAQAAYTYSQALRQALAIANLANAVDSILGMLPT